MLLVLEPAAGELGGGAYHEASGKWTVEQYTDIRSPIKLSTSSGSRPNVSGGGGEPARLVIELLPKPFMWHFVVGGHPAETSELQQRLAARLAGLCKPGKRLRLWDEPASGADERTAAMASSPNYLLLFSPGVWSCPSVLDDLRAAEQQGKNIILVYRPMEDQPHVPEAPTPSSPVVSKAVQQAAVRLGDVIASAPPDVQNMFELIEAVPYRLQPFAEDACLQHIAHLGGWGANLQKETPESAGKLLEAQAMRDLQSANTAAAAADTSEPKDQLAASTTFYYEGVAMKAGSGALRGWYQATITFQPAQGRITAAVLYEPKINNSMPRYEETFELTWDQTTGRVRQLEKLLATKGALWEGEVSGLAGILRLQETWNGEQDALTLWSMPFAYHFFITGVQNETGVPGSILASLLESTTAAGRRPRTCLAFGLPESAARAAALKQSAVVLLFLSRGVWNDAGCLADLRAAALLGKRVIFVQDPDPRMKSFVHATEAVALAPTELRSMFNTHDILPFYRRWFEQASFVNHLLTVAGFVSSIKLPYDQEQFALTMAEQKSDVSELQVMKAGRWFYYEGWAERANKGKIMTWGCYQIDAKFKPEQQIIELLVEFESKTPGSVPSYKAQFNMQWSQDDGSIVERREPVRWRGRVEGGIGGTFHIRNNYGDSLTFVKQPFVWHFFLSHIQREASDYCSMMATRMADLSVRGKRIRTWYDNAAAVVNKEAMALGITHSQVFILFLTPSVFKSVYVAFEIKTALELRKPIILVVREDAVTPEGGSLFDALQAEAPSELAAVFSRAVAVLRFPCTAAGSTDTDDFMRQLMTAGGFAGNIAPAT